MWDSFLFDVSEREKRHCYNTCLFPALPNSALLGMATLVRQWLRHFDFVFSSWSSTSHEIKNVSMTHNPEHSGGDACQMTFLSEVILWKVKLKMQICFRTQSHLCSAPCLLVDLTFFPHLQSVQSGWPEPLRSRRIQVFLPLWGCVLSCSAPWKPIKAPSQWKLHSVIALKEAPILISK